MEVEIQAPTSVSIGFWREDLGGRSMIYGLHVGVRISPTEALWLGLQRALPGKNAFCRAPWKIGLGNSLALEILAMKIFALTATFFFARNIFFGRAPWEGRSKLKKASEAPFSGQNSPLTFRDRSGRTERFFRSCLRASPPRTFPSNIFLQAFCFDTFDFPQTELARRCHRAGRNCKRAKSFYYAVSGWGFLQSQKERLIWSW